jgi:hypothetical protein
LHVVFLDQLLLPVDGIVEFNVPPNPFPVKTAFLIIQCGINQLLLYKSLVFDFYCLFPFIQPNVNVLAFSFFTVVPCILILSKRFIYQLMRKRIALKKVLKFTLKQLLHVSVQSPSSGSALFEFAKIKVVKIID